MRDTIVAIALTEARSKAEPVMRNGGTKRDVALTVMRATRENWMAPDEDEAFAAAVGALWALYPDDEDLRQETKAVGDANKMLGALANGIPIDFDAWEPTPMPDNKLGLVELWRETA